MQHFQFAALTPPGCHNPSIAIAASRAGGLGVLDLEYSQNERAALDAIAKLAQYAKQQCAIKLDGQPSALTDHVVAVLPPLIDVVILTSAAPDDLHRQVQTCRRQGRTLILEVTSLEQARLGVELAVDGLIAKGHEAGGRVGSETTFILLQQLSQHVSLPFWAQGGIGLYTAGACFAAGASGVVLDTQLALTRESALSEAVKRRISMMDGSETVCLGGGLGESYML